MNAAANDSPLPADVRAAVTARLAKARRDVDTSAAGDEAGQGPRGVERALAQATTDVDLLLKEQSPVFAARVARITGDVRDLGRLDTSGVGTMIDLLLAPTPDQKQKIADVLTEQRRQVEQIGLGPRDGAELRRIDVGVATRAALRAIFTPHQLADWDATPGVKAAAPVASATTHPAGPSDAEAGQFTRLEAMKLAAMELADIGAGRGITPDQRQRIIDRVEKMRADIATVSAEPITAKSKPTAERIDALRKDFLTDTTTTLGDRVGRFDDRVDQILSQIYTLRSPTLSLDHIWVSHPANDLALSKEQERKLDQILAARVPKIKAIEAAAQPDDAATIVRMKKDQVAFTTRAALRAALTPQQIRNWDTPAFLGK